MPTYTNIDLADTAIWNTWNTILNSFLNGWSTILSSGWFQGSLMIFGSLAIILLIWRTMHNLTEQ